MNIRIFAYKVTTPSNEWLSTEKFITGITLHKSVSIDAFMKSKIKLMKVYEKHTFPNGLIIEKLAITQKCKENHEHKHS